MCGILGVAINPKETKESVLNDIPGLLSRLMIANHYRGGDSYGIAVVPRNGDAPFLYRRIGKFPEDLKRTKKARPWHRQMRKVQALIDADVPFVVMGHNRKATHGEVNERNAMPFMFGRPDQKDWIIGIHNGVMRYHRELLKHFDLSTIHTEVDSEAIFRVLQRQPSQKALPYIDDAGSASIVYMNGDLNKLYMWRNTNPLYISERDGFLVWSSEDRGLRTALGPIAQEVLPTAANKHHTIDLRTLRFAQSIHVETERIPNRYSAYIGKYVGAKKSQDTDDYDPFGWRSRYGSSSSPYSSGSSDSVVSKVSARKREEFSFFDKRTCSGGCHETRNVTQLIWTKEGHYCGWCAHGPALTMDGWNDMWDYENEDDETEVIVAEIDDDGKVVPITVIKPDGKREEVQN